MHVWPKGVGDTRSQLMLAKKPTKFLTNSKELGRELRRKCDGTHLHQPLLGGRAKDAARYPPSLCRAICRGILREKTARACGVTAVLSMASQAGTALPDVEEHHEKEETDIPALIRKLEAQEEERRTQRNRRRRGRTRGRLGTSDGTVSHGLDHVPQTPDAVQEQERQRLVTTGER